MRSIVRRLALTALLAAAVPWLWLAAVDGWRSGVDGLGRMAIVGVPMSVMSVVLWVPACLWLFATETDEGAMGRAVVFGLFSPIVGSMFAVPGVGPAFVIAAPWAVFPVGLAMGLVVFLIARVGRGEGANRLA